MPKTKQPIQITWDYTALASSYNQRAPYSTQLLDQVIKLTGLNHSNVVCDVGAGTGFLSGEWAVRKINVLAVEPNDAMRKIGIASCQKLNQIKWFNAQAENLQQPTDSVDMVSYGSSFNVVNRSLALQEAARIGKPQSWFFAIWNHRDIQGGLQAKIEAFIYKNIPSYQYGVRRQSQAEFLQKSGYFSHIEALRHEFVFQQKKQDVIDAWHSHATLKRQAGDQYDFLLDGISHIINQENSEIIKTPFYSQAWLAIFK